MRLQLVGIIKLGLNIRIKKFRYSFICGKGYSPPSGENSFLSAFWDAPAHAGVFRFCPVREKISARIPTESYTKMTEFAHSRAGIVVTYRQGHSILWITPSITAEPAWTNCISDLKSSAKKALKTGLFFDMIGALS